MRWSQVESQGPSLLLLIGIGFVTVTCAQLVGRVLRHKGLAFIVGGISGALIGYCALKWQGIDAVSQFYWPALSGFIGATATRREP